MVQEKVGRLDLAHGSEQETIPAVFSNRVEWSGAGRIPASVEWMRNRMEGVQQR